MRKILKWITYLAIAAAMAGCNFPGGYSGAPTGIASSTAEGFPNTGGEATDTITPAAAVTAPFTPAPLQLIAITFLNMVTPQQGWAAGMWIGACQVWMGCVMRTDDGGLHWQNHNPAIQAAIFQSTGSSVAAAPAPGAIYTLDMAHVWVVFTLSPSGNVMVVHTSDGGQSWKASQPLPASSAGPGWLYFLDAQHGWLMSNLGAGSGSNAVSIWSTTDGGLGWKKVEGTPPGSQPAKGSLPLACNKTGLAFVDPFTGWATGDCAGGQPFFQITQDGGQTWQEQALPAPPGLAASAWQNCQCATTAPQFVSPQVGMAMVKISAARPSAYLYVTQDAGKSWTPYALPTGSPIGRPSFINADSGWITDGSQVYQTQDGGKNWKTVGPMPAGQELRGELNFVDQQTGYANGSSQIFITRDSGATWFAIIPQMLPQNIPNTGSLPPAATATETPTFTATATSMPVNNFTALPTDTPAFIAAATATPAAMPAVTPKAKKSKTPTAAPTTSATNSPGTATPVAGGSISIDLSSGAIKETIQPSQTASIVVSNGQISAMVHFTNTVDYANINVSIRQPAGSDWKASPIQAPDSHTYAFSLSGTTLGQFEVDIRYATGQPALVFQVSAQQGIPVPGLTTPIQFPPGLAAVTVTNTLTADVPAAYTLQADPGQNLSVSINGTASVQVYDSDNNPITGIQSQSGPWDVTLNKGGAYTLAMMGVGPVVLSLYLAPAGSSAFPPVPLPAAPGQLILRNGTAAITDTLQQGAPQGYTFSASSGQNLTIAINGYATAAVLDTRRSITLQPALLQPGQLAYVIPSEGNYLLVLLGVGEVKVTASIK